MQIEYTESLEQKFYARFGMQPSVGMVIRDY
jgi:hypothetical protein